MKIRILITITGIILSTTSCTHTETMTYPTEWASKTVVEKSDCSEIIGTYKAIGENAQYSENGINNPHFFALFGFYSKGVGDIIYINLSSDSSTLTMSTPLSNSDNTKEKSKNINISCVNGVVLYKDTGQSVSDGNTIQWLSNVEISKTEDNAIVVRRYGTSNTGSFIFNIKRNYDVLYRFPSNG